MGWMLTVDDFGCCWLKSTLDFFEVSGHVSSKKLTLLTSEESHNSSCWLEPVFVVVGWRAILGDGEELWHTVGELLCIWVCTTRFDNADLIGVTS